VTPPPEGSRYGSGQDWRTLLPAAVLLVVASMQVVLTHTSGLSPWKGGGFGMFSTSDDAGHRQLRIFVSAPGRSEELAIPPSLEDDAGRAAVLPSDARLSRLAQRVADRERRHQRPVDTVRIETWRTVYAKGTLLATRQLLREFRWPGVATSALSQ
jgi:hypothetical protein